MTALKQMISGIIDFLIDYFGRHKHPLNAFLHIFGVPMAFYGFYDLITGRFAEGSAFVVLGYFLQYLGHRAQGNEVGEVILIKKIWAKLQKKEAGGQQ